MLVEYKKEIAFLGIVAYCYYHHNERIGEIVETKKGYELIILAAGKHHTTCHKSKESASAYLYRWFNGVIASC